MMTRSAWVVGFVMVVGGCVAEVGDEDTSSTEQFAKPCPDFGCGENSPISGPFNIRWLDKTGGPNQDGLKLLGFMKNGHSFKVNVLKDRVQALYNTYQPIVAFEHQNLIGGYFRISHPAVAGLPAGEVQLWVMGVDVAGQDFWVGPSGQVETYDLKYTGAGTVSDPVPACKNPLPGTGIRDMAIDGEGRTWKNRFNSIIFTGDLYDSDNYTVTIPTGTAANNILNIACAGSAPAKLHLNRHTTASVVPGWPTTTWQQRQTMLKMYAGDFCGDGYPYTVMGTPIHWSSSTGLSSPPGNDGSFESLWNENGAVCMDVHRLANSPNHDYAAWQQLLKDTCVPRKCADIPGFPNQSGFYIATQSKGALP